LIDKKTIVILIAVSEVLKNKEFSSNLFVSIEINIPNSVFYLRKDAIFWALIKIYHL
jgi:hypothetical protein